jgi:hypothetical protein
MLRRSYNRYSLALQGVTSYLKFTIPTIFTIQKMRPGLPILLLFTE